MATSGSFNTSSVGSFYFTFEWYRTGYNSSTNEHYIHWTLYAHNTPGSYRTVYLKNLWVNGSQRLIESGGKQYYDGNVVASGDTTVSSHNSAGDGWFSASFEAGVGVSSGSNCNGSGSWDLDRIPRYTTVWNSERGRTLNTISVNWSTSDARDWTQYSLNGGSWQNAYDTVSSDNKSGYYTISNLSPNTKYTVRTRCRRADSGLWSEAGSISITTKDIVRIMSASAADFGENVNINFSNLENGISKLTVKIGETEICSREDLTSAYTLSFTKEELSKLIKLLKDETTEITYVVTTNSIYNATAKSIITLKANIYVKKEGTWIKAKLYKKDSSWKLTKLFFKVAGTWRNTK